MKEGEMNYNITDMRIKNKCFSPEIKIGLNFPYGKKRSKVYDPRYLLEI